MEIYNLSDLYVYKYIYIYIYIDIGIHLSPSNLFTWW